MEEKKRYKIAMAVSLAVVFISIITVIYQQTIISQLSVDIESTLNDIEPPSNSWVSDNVIFALTNSSSTFWETKIYIQNFDGNQNNSIGKISFRDVNYTGSMNPTMFGGQILIVLDVKDKNLIEKGDIIGFQAENKSIVHRVVERNYDENTDELFFRTKGDNYIKMDKWIVKPDAILGVVVGILY